VSELRTFKIAAILATLDVPVFSTEQIAELLWRAQGLGLDLGPGSHLAELTLAELAILVADVPEWPA
jgi:hypothetical protein